MLETTLKGMLRLSCREKLIARRVSEKELESGMIYQEMDLMSQFGNVKTHRPPSPQANDSKTLQVDSAALMSSLIYPSHTFTRSIF